MFFSLKRVGVSVLGVLCLMISGCEIEDDCAGAEDIEVNFKITAAFQTASGEPVALGIPARISTTKLVCGSDNKSVAPTNGATSAAGTLTALVGYNLRSKDDAVRIEAQFVSGSGHSYQGSQQVTLTYDELQSSNGSQRNVDLVVQSTN